MDNERPIEKLLRDYAKKRRADAGEPKEMHPATRRLLQGEVARQFPKSQPGGFSLSGFFARWKPGFVYALCALAIVAASVPLLLPTFRNTGTETELARAVPGEAALEKKLPAPTDALSAAQETDGARRSDDKRQVTLTRAGNERAKDSVSLKMEVEEKSSPPARNLAADTSVRSAPATAASAPQIANRNQPQPTSSAPVQTRLEPATREMNSVVTETAAVGGEKTKAGRDAQAAISPESASGPADAQLAAKSPRAVPTPAAITAPAPTPTVSAAFTDRYGLAKSAAATVVQKFSQTVATGNLRRSPEPATAAAPILTTFQLEQTGDRLRVIDSDGSTYSGALTPAATDVYDERAAEPKGVTAPTVGGQRVARGVSGLADSSSASAQNFSFQVTGTNRTLQQAVIFSGNFLLRTNAPTGGQANFQQTNAAQSQNQFAPTQNQLPNLLNSTISGKVRLGTNREMQINAVPISR